MDRLTESLIHQSGYLSIFTTIYYKYCQLSGLNPLPRTITESRAKGSNPWSHSEYFLLFMGNRTRDLSVESLPQNKSIYYKVLPRSRIDPWSSLMENHAMSKCIVIGQEVWPNYVGMGPSLDNLAHAERQRVPPYVVYRLLNQTHYYPRESLWQLWQTTWQGSSKSHLDI